MTTTLLIIESLLLLGMITVSLYAARILPHDAQVPVHFGPGYYNNWMPRNVGLVLHPALGAVVYVIFVVTAFHARADGTSGPTIGLTLALVVMLLVQTGAIRIALTRSGRRPG
jgi:hypothetical protein